MYLAVTDGYVSYKETVRLYEELKRVQFLWFRQETQILNHICFEF